VKRGDGLNDGLTIDFNDALKNDDATQELALVG